jgi:hygromycin-B 7''-O-kinase
LRHLADRYGLQGEPRRGFRGSHIVYSVGQAWIKIMAPIFAKDMAFEIAGLKVAQDLPIATPKILAQGELEGWLYITLSHLPASASAMSGVVVRIKSSLPSKWLRPHFNCNLAKSRRRFKPEVIGTRSFVNASPVTSFIIALKKWMSAGSQTFLDRFDATEFTTENPVFLHADLTFDHFLVGETASGMKILGVIDFADCRLGHPEYDMPASLAFVLRGEQDALCEYLQAFGYKPTELNQRFSLGRDYGSRKSGHGCRESLCYRND